MGESCGGNLKRKGQRSRSFGGLLLWQESRGLALLGEPRLLACGWRLGREPSWQAERDHPELPHWHVKLLGPVRLSQCVLQGRVRGPDGGFKVAVGQPAALSGDIVDIVSALASDTVDAPRKLSTPQLTRLQEIAELHSGRVPLHGRLFAQWMHHAYPRECPFPHVAGTTKPVSQDEWEVQGLEAEATEEEMTWHSTQATWSETETLHDLLPWHDGEGWCQCISTLRRGCS